MPIQVNHSVLYLRTATRRRRRGGRARRWRLITGIRPEWNTYSVLIGILDGEIQTHQAHQTSQAPGQVSRSACGHYLWCSQHSHRCKRKCLPRNRNRQETEPASHQKGHSAVRFHFSPSMVAQAERSPHRAISRYQASFAVIIPSFSHAKTNGER